MELRDHHHAVLLFYLMLCTTCISMNMLIEMHASDVTFDFLLDDSSDFIFSPDAGFQ